MNETQEYLNKYQSLCMEQLEYLSRRMYQRRAMDEEIEDLFKRAKWNYAYVCSILEGKQPPTIMESDPNNIGPSHPPAPPAPRRVGSAAARRPKKKRSYSGPRPVLQLDARGNVLRRFDSLRQASELTGLLANYISIAAHTRSYTTDGSHWCFEDDFNALVAVDDDITTRVEKYTASDIPDPKQLIGGLLGVDVTRPILPESAVDADAAGGKPDDKI